MLTNLDAHPLPDLHDGWSVSMRRHQSQRSRCVSTDCSFTAAQIDRSLVPRRVPALPAVQVSQLLASIRYGKSELFRTVGVLCRC
jgi:hypothetical protein